MNYKVYLTSSGKAKKLKKVTEPCIVAIEPEDFTKKEVLTLKERGYTVLGYLSIGSVSDERPYYSKLKQYCLKRLKDWPHEWYIDLRRTAVRDWCITRAREIKALGCDGWWVDNVDVYEEYKSSSMYQAVLFTLRRLKGLGGYVNVNGGLKFFEDKMNEEPASAGYVVQCGAFGSYSNAETLRLSIKYATGIEPVIRQEDIGVNLLNKVQTGAFTKFDNAYKQMLTLRKHGFTAEVMLKQENFEIIPIRNYVDAVVQEEVITRIVSYSGKGKFGHQEADESSNYKRCMYRLKVHGMNTFLLEYSDSSSTVSTIKQFVKDYGLTGYYCSSDVNL